MDVHTPSNRHLSRRDLLKWSGAGLAAVAAVPAAWSPARAQSPKRGGTLSLRLWDPPHWDPHLTISYKTHIAYSFTHSRLLKHKAGPAVTPGTFPIDGDLAESWTQPNETTYVFKLRRGVRWQPRPPVNGRELTAEDVRYSVERFLTVPGNVLATTLRVVERVEALDRHTVRFTLKEPFAWFLDMLAAPMAVAIVAKECVDKFTDLKPWESVIGTGPWMLDSYRPNVGFTLVRNPGYFLAGPFSFPAGASCRPRRPASKSSHIEKTFIWSTIPVAASSALTARGIVRLNTGIARGECASVSPSASSSSQAKS